MLADPPNPPPPRSPAGSGAPRSRTGTVFRPWRWPGTALLLGAIAAAGLTRAAEPSIPPELLGWTPEVSARLRGGYKDNVLLSSFSPEASGFIGAGLEGFLARTFSDSWSLEVFVDGEERHYFSADAVADEQTAFAMAQLQRRWAASWSLKLGTEYLFQNQVVDVSATEPQFETMQVVGHAIVVRPSVRWSPGDLWLELQTPGQRQLYESPLDDSWQYGVKLQLGLPVDTTSDYSLSYEFARNPFDTEADRAPNALPIPGSQRVMDQHDGRWTWRQAWDETRRWQTIFRLSVKAAFDHASGYYDYVRGQVFLQVRYRHKDWEVSAESRWGHYAYPVQTVAADDPALRRRTEWACGLHGERRLSRHWQAVADYSHEQTQGNRVGDDYSANTVSAGLNFRF